MNLKVQAPKEIKKPLLEGYIRIITDLLDITGCDIEFQITQVEQDLKGRKKLGGMYPVSYDNGRYSFYIAIDEGVPQSRQQIAICHELIHVQQFLGARLQYAKNLCSMTDVETGEELPPAVIDTGWTWDGKFYSKSTEYTERPWEIDAKSRELALAKKASAVYDEKYSGDLAKTDVN